MHGITKTDGAVYAGTPAWHGLGRVVENAPTPAEALQLAKLNWSVLESAGVSGMVELPGEPAAVRFATDESKLLVRSDTREVLACVSSGYMPIQNAELAELANIVAGESANEVRVESAASIFGGRRVWFLLRGEPFALNKGKDEVHRYLLMANGHDGRLALTLTPTSVRVVCNNTLTMAIGESKRSRNLAWIRHTGTWQDKQKQAVQAIKRFKAAGDAFEDAATALASKSLKRDEIQEFWVDVYAALEEPFKANPSTKAEARAKTKAVDAIANWTATFDRENKVAGATAWNALNAVTNWYDHTRQVRAKDDTARNARRLEKRLIGDYAESKAKAMDMALALL